MRILETLTVRGYLSIYDQELHLDRFNVLIGANGSGKSNLIQVFHLLQNIASRKLQLFVGREGGANRLLHYGRNQTTAIDIAVSFTEPPYTNGYQLRLIPTANDSLVFEDESVSFHNTERYEFPLDRQLGAGHKESELQEVEDRIAGHLLSDLNNIHIYQFHDTGPNAQVRQTCKISDNIVFHHNGSNLSAFLYYLERQHPRHFKRIERSVRSIAPFFQKFILHPSRLNSESIQLEWKDIHDDMHFGTSALPDGLLRFICLATALSQSKLPSLMILDEPELGLHPAAITYLAGLLRKCEHKCQIVSATQSVTLLNQLSPDNIWIAEREGGKSIFKPLVEENLTPWLEQYSVGDIWEKNLIGGRP
ncbi:MAG: AAA family ATPase [Caldilineaceae bacterium SB0666_bin_21]|nr:AAA family ATPase [Caldilineaceae bacterium SB0666_bin_21]